jgi:hypothetical protein
MKPRLISTTYINPRFPHSPFSTCILPTTDIQKTITQIVHFLPLASLILDPLPGSYPREFAQPPIVPLPDSIAGDTEYEMLPDQLPSTEENVAPPPPQPNTLQDLPLNAPEEPAVDSIQEPQIVETPDKKEQPQPFVDLSAPDPPEYAPEESIATDENVQPETVDIEPATVPDLPAVDSLEESVAAPEIETPDSFHYMHLPASMVSPAVQQVRISNPLEAPDAESTKKSTNVQAFVPWMLPESVKAPSIISDSSHLAPSVAQIRTLRLEDPDARTDSSAGSIHDNPVAEPVEAVEPVPDVQPVSDVQPIPAVQTIPEVQPVPDTQPIPDVQPVEAPTTEAPVEAPVAKSESGSESSLGLGNLVAHAPQNLPPQFSKPAEPQVQLFL